MAMEGDSRELRRNLFGTDVTNTKRAGQPRAPGDGAPTKPEPSSLGSQPRSAQQGDSQPVASSSSGSWAARRAAGESRAKALSSAAKAIEVAVLTLYETDTTAQEVDEVVFANYREDATYENAVTKVKGLNEVRSAFFAMRALLWRCHVIRPVKAGLWVSGGGAEGAQGVRLLLDLSVEYQLLPLSPSIALKQFIHLQIDAEGRVFEHKDHWCLQSAISGIPLIGTFAYPAAKRVLGYFVSAVAGFFQPRVTLIYKTLLQS